MTVKAGQFKGKRVEQNQKRLSEFLKKRLGEPDLYSGGLAAAIASREKVYFAFRGVGRRLAETSRLARRMGTGSHAALAGAGKNR
jgi:hypothetical protein